MAYKFIRTPYKSTIGLTSDPMSVTVEMDQDSTIPEMLIAFEGFLRASGYVFDGTLDIVEEKGPDVSMIYGGEVLGREDIESWTVGESGGEMIIKASSWAPGMWAGSEGWVFPVKLNGKAIRLQIEGVDLEHRILKVKELE